MAELVFVRRASLVEGAADAPGDKSISHRALILAALGEGTIELRGLAPGADVRSTARCLTQLGVPVAIEGDRARVDAVGPFGLRAPDTVLDCGNSGTTMRLLAGVLAGSGVGGVLDGDESLRRRPMRRVLDPLRAMGAKVSAGDRAPLRIEPGHPLAGVRHELQVSSAQVKSALLLAGLWASGETSVSEPALSRDHTERMLAAYGADLRTDGPISVRPLAGPLHLPRTIDIPGDPSSAAFLLAAGALLGEVEVRGVCVNPTRTGFLEVLARMGAACERLPVEGTEPTADLRIRRTGLRATEIRPEEIPALVDEVPILAVLATQATGTTMIRGAAELRVKESDRLALMAAGLTAMGARVEELPDGLRIEGPTPLHGAALDAGGDHRIAMSLAVAALVAEGETRLSGAGWVDISYPGFFEILGRLSQGAVRAGGAC